MGSEVLQVTNNGEFNTVLYSDDNGENFRLVTLSKASENALSQEDGVVILKVDNPRNMSIRDVKVTNGITRERKHQHYFKPVAGFSEVDVYRLFRMFNVTDQAIGHAIKKLLVAGGRGVGKDINRDVDEAIDTLNRWKELELEDFSHANKLEVKNFGPL